MSAHRQGRSPRGISDNERLRKRQLLTKHINIGTTEKNSVNDRRLAGPRQKYVDIHCHCLPGLDDGPATMQEAVALCRLLVEDGVETVVATPHQLGRFDGRNHAERILDSTAELNEQLQKAALRLKVLPGADVRLDERIIHLLEDGRILTLAGGGRYILLEMPHGIFIEIGPLLKQLASVDVTAVISHPERHIALANDPQLVLKLLELGAVLQITAASLLGRFGPQPEKAGWRFLACGWASVVATDAHDLRQRPPQMNSAFEKITAKLGEDTARLLCMENPSMIVKGCGLKPLRPRKYRQSYI